VTVPVTRAGTGPAQPGLLRRQAEVPAGEQLAGTAGPGGDLWFVIEGAGWLTAAGQAGPDLVPDRALWIPAGARYQVAAGPAARLRLDLVSLPAAGAAGAGRPLARDLSACPAETTGDRTFRVLFGPGRDCAAATQFVGDIPPGRAPEHSHPYDKVVLILAGTGVAHTGAGDRELAAGTGLHLPPGRPHCLENTGPGLLRVLGVFHPAGSPAAKLPPAP
jgi:quercetin dioxygenase-like cupin family protein